MDKWRMILTVTSDSPQELLDLVRKVKKWKMFEHINYVVHSYGVNKEPGVADDDDEQVYGKGGGFTPEGR